MLLLLYDYMEVSIKLIESIYCTMSTSFYVSDIFYKKKLFLIYIIKYLLYIILYYILIERIDCIYDENLYKYFLTLLLVFFVHLF